jgi:dephospho-CoA kinase
MIVGIMGSSGSGKTSLARLIEEMGYFRISLDDLAKRITPSLLGQIQAEFGPEVVVDGQLDRKRLGDLTFSDAEALDRLSAIFVDPLWDALRGEMSSHEKVVVEGYDLPVGLVPDLLIHVTAPDAVLISRLIIREPGTSLDTLRNRLERQKRTVVPPGLKVVEINTVMFERDQLAEHVRSLVSDLVRA